MAFEHENQMVKHGAHGNFQDPVWNAAESKALRVALVAEEAKRQHLAADLVSDLVSDLEADLEAGLEAIG